MKVFLTLVLAAFGALTYGETRGAAIGQIAPDFELADLDGRAHALSAYRGRVTIVAFLATKCPISNDYNERLRALAADYNSRQVAFLAINASADETPGEIRAHAARHGFTFPLLKDGTGSIADAYGATRTPEVYLIDKEGVLRYRGRIDNARKAAQIRRRDVREALDELLAGKAISVPETKSFGCPIKRSKSGAPTAAQAKPAPAPVVRLLKPVDYARVAGTAGRVTVVNFWATWCGPCVAEFPELVALDAKYRSRGVRFVGISADEKEDIQPKVIPFVRDMKASFEIFVQDVADPQEMIDVVNKDWDGTLPATFVYDRGGKLSFIRYGIIDREVLTAEIEKALK
jgi:thiol-disulfide isomerase/thioredoxin